MRIEIDGNEPLDQLYALDKFIAVLINAAEKISEFDAWVGEAPDKVDKAPDKVDKAPDKVDMAPDEGGESSLEPEPEVEQIVTVTPGVELDAAGIPWDVRIHSGGKTKKADGTWTRRRGVSKEEAEALAQELVGAPAEPPEIAEAQEAFGVAPVVDLTWPDVVKRALELRKAGTLSDEKATQWLGQYGVAAFAQLATRPDLWAGYLEAMAQ